MKNTKELVMIVSFVLVLLTVLILLLIKIQMFMVSYESCVDDFQMIEKCGCLPAEGNYSYFGGENIQLLTGVKLNVSE